MRPSGERVPACSDELGEGEAGDVETGDDSSSESGDDESPGDASCAFRGDVRSPLDPSGCWRGDNLWASSLGIIILLMTWISCLLCRCQRDLRSLYKWHSPALRAYFFCPWSLQ